MGGSVNTEVIDFTAGMNTVRASHLIAPNECQAIVNVNIKDGSLLSMPSLIHLSPALQPHFTEFREEILYYPNFRTNARLGNNLYWADGLNTGKVMFDGRRLPLGITPPTTIAAIESAANPGFGTHTGDFQYTYTFYSTDTGVESAPAPLPPYLTVDKEDIVITALEALPPTADAYRIYRIGGYLPRFTMVTQLAVEPATSARGTITLGGTTAVGGLDITVEIRDDLGAVVGLHTYNTDVGDTPEMIANSLALRINISDVYTTTVIGEVIHLKSVGVGVTQNSYTLTTTSLDTNITIAHVDPTGATAQVDTLPYTDVLDDTEIDGRLLTTLRSGAPLAGMNDFVELNGRLFGSKGANLYFSAAGNPDAWYINNFFTMPDNITGTAKTPAGLLVFGESYTYLLLGTAPQNFRLKVISNVLGCIARESIAYLDDQVIWLSETGLCMSNGYQIKDLTSDKIETIIGIQPISACVLNEVYYLAFKPSLFPTEELFPNHGLYPDGSVGTGDLEEGLIYLDFKRGRNYSYGMYSYPNVASIGILDAELHVVTFIPNVTFLSCVDPLPCDGYLQCNAYDLNLAGKLRGADFTELFYISPTFVDGSYSTLKQYEKIRLNMIGEFNIKAIFSDGKVAIEEDIKVTDEVTIVDGKAFSRDDVTLMGIPNAENHSYSIAFVIRGRGVIKSIQYSWKNRELP